MKQRQKAITYLILSAFFFAWMNAFVRLSGNLPSMQKAFFRNFIALFVAIAVLAKEGKGIHIQKNCLPFHLVRSIGGLLGVICNFYAIDRLPLANASILNKMSPFFAILFSFLLLGEKLNWKQGAIVLMAFAGSLFIIKPVPTNLELLPSLAGLMGGIGAGLAYTMVRKMGLMGERGTVIVFFFAAFSSVMLLPNLILNYAPMTMTQLLTLMGAGVAAAGGQICITRAYTFAPAREISVYDYTQIIFSGALGFLLFGQIPDGWSFLGDGVIIGAAVLMFLYNNGRLSRSQG